MNFSLIILTGFIGYIFYMTIMIPYYFTKIVILIISEIIKYNKIKGIEFELKKNDNIEYIKNGRYDY
jgi:hypothetical protein